MTDKINGRTPEEIKKGLECRARWGTHDCKQKCDECDVFVPGLCGTSLRDALALAYIQRLEAERDQYKRERDAAVEAAHGVCKACIHFNGHYPPGDIMSCCKFEECLYGMDEWDAEDHWQWRGVQEVE